MLYSDHVSLQFLLKTENKKNYLESNLDIVFSFNIIRISFEFVVLYALSNNQIKSGKPRGHHSSLSPIFYVVNIQRIAEM